MNKVKIFKGNLFYGSSSVEKEVNEFIAESVSRVIHIQTSLTTNNDIVLVLLYE